MRYKVPYLPKVVARRLPLLVVDGIGTVTISSVNGGAGYALDVGEVAAGTTVGAWLLMPT